MVSILPAVFSILLMMIGTTFLLAAAIGVLRFSDALQRMHASTKAGTVGATFIVLGAIVAQSPPDTAVVGGVAIAFLLLTVPIAGHLLGRAIYVSGAKLNLKLGNALEGQLHRQRSPLERRTEFQPLPFVSERKDQHGSVSTPTEPLAEVRFALIAPDVDAVVDRSLSVATRQQVPLRAIAAIDERFITASRAPATTREKVRDKVASAVTRLHEKLPRAMDDFSLLFEAGDPVALIADQASGSLLVLPPRGWCHHGVDALTPEATGRPEGLLRLANTHRGPVLFVGDKPLPETGARLAVLDDGSDALVESVIWALESGLWSAPSIALIAKPSAKRLRTIEDALKKTGAAYSLGVMTQTTKGIPLLPPSAADFDALIITALPRPMRADWYGLSWHEQIAHGWKGEVFVAPKTGAGP